MTDGMADDWKQKLADEELVRGVLRPLPYESLAQTATRICYGTSYSPMRVRVAEIVLGPGDPWERLHGAARAIKNMEPEP